MSRANKQKVVTLLEEWARLRAKAERIEAARDRDLKQIQERFDRASAPIEEAANKKLEPLGEKVQAIEKQITEILKAGIGKDGVIAMAHVASEDAIAEVITSSNREIDPKTFFNSVRSAKRTAEFWKCVKVLIQQADKFLGKNLVTKMAKEKPSYSIEIKPREEEE